jgi:predicted neuraminidase
MQNGHWALAYNDTENGRHSLAVAISTDEGKSWAHSRHIERDLRDRQIATSSGYPSIIQGRDGTLHAVYSYHRKDRKADPSKTIMYVQLNEAWVKKGRTSQGK